MTNNGDSDGGDKPRRYTMTKNDGGRWKLIEADGGPDDEEQWRQTEDKMTRNDGGRERIRNERGQERGWGRRCAGPHG